MRNASGEEESVRNVRRSIEEECNQHEEQEEETK